MVKITFLPANKVVEAVVGQDLKDVAAAARVPVKYNCKKVRARVGKGGWGAWRGSIDT